MTTIIEHKGIATIIGSTRLSVPVHQRSYEWTKEEVSELLSDLEGAFARGRDEYFLGSIVVVAANDTDRHSVLDGQQRLATGCLLLGSIADRFASVDERDAAAAVRQHLASYDIDQGVFSSHLRLNQEDDPYFRTLLSDEVAEPAPDAPASHSKLYQARRQTHAWVIKHTGNPASAVTWLKDFIRYLRESVRVIYFGVPDDANAFLIFETLNDRGLDLSIADLLKNYLLGRAGDDLANVLAQWTRVLTTLKAYGTETTFTTFLRHYWSSKYEVVREKDLYRAVKARVTSSANVIDFVGELAKNSYFYTALLSSDHEYWAGISIDGRERLRSLAVLGLEQYRPMLLAALAHFEPLQVEEVLRLLESWNVRLVVVGGLGGGVMESKYAELGRAIRGGDIKNPRELAAKATDFVPADAEFKASFGVATVSKVALARYYLRTLELGASGTKNAEMVPSPSLTLEHILPERPGGNYPAFSEEQRSLYTRRIGNLALLTHKVNSDAKSAPFAEKKEVYRASDLRLTKEVADYGDWTPAAVDDRQAKLAERAAAAWPLTLK